MIPATRNDEEWERDVIIMTHQMNHVMIFSRSLWELFVDYDISQVLDTNDPMGDGHDYVISPKVAEVAKDHFNCSSLVGLPLDASSSHWNQRLLQSSAMSAELWSSEQYVSIFTFALMEDSGWYYVNYQYAKPFKWG